MPSPRSGARFQWDASERELSGTGGTSRGRPSEDGQRPEQESNPNPGQAAAEGARRRSPRCSGVTGQSAFIVVVSIIARRVSARRGRCRRAAELRELPTSCRGPADPVIPGAGPRRGTGGTAGSVGTARAAGSVPSPFPPGMRLAGSGKQRSEVPGFWGFIFSLLFYFFPFFPNKRKSRSRELLFPSRRTHGRGLAAPDILKPPVFPPLSQMPQGFRSGGGGARCPPASHGLPRGGRSAPGTENGDFSLCEPTEPLPAPSRGPSRGPRGEGEMPADAHPEPLPRGTPAVHPLPRMGLRPGA